MRFGGGSSVRHRVAAIVLQTSAGFQRLVAESGSGMMEQISFFVQKEYNGLVDAAVGDVRSTRALR
jgi:hypothetical protein